MSIKAKINGDMIITDGNNELRSLKELNTQVTNLIPVELYNNDTGATSVNISTLSQYKFVDIEIRTVVYDRKSTLRMYLDSSQFKEVFSICFWAYDGRLQNLSCDIVYNGSNNLSLSQQYYINYNISGSIASISTIDRMRITKVIGYKA